MLKIGKSFVATNPLKCRNGTPVNLFVASSFDG
jgi:hypothetical protein